MSRFNLSRWAIEHGNFTRFLIVLLMGVGVLAYLQLGRKEDPDFTFRVMVVSAYWPGATAREMEMQVTDVLEKKLQETPNLDYTQSYSKPGESQILVVARQQARGREISDTWYQVRKKVSDIRDQLPSGVVGPYFNDEFGDTYIAMYTFTADGFSDAELKDYVDGARNRLLRLDGVQKVDLLGEQAQKVYVEFSQRRFAELGLSLDQLSSALQGQNAMAPAGSVVTNTMQLPLRISGDYDTVHAISELRLRGNGHAYRLGDFARVYRGYEDPPVYRIRHHGHDALALGVVMAPGRDVLALGKSLHQEVGHLQDELPVGIQVTQVTDQPKVVDESIGTFVRSLAEAIIIVLLVSFLSLGVRTGLVVALSIPLVLAVTFLAMWYLGIDLQKVSLGALVLALGLLVDDAMISVEMMARKLEDGLERIDAASFAYRSTAFPMLTGTLITAAGFLPIALARSASGEYTFSMFAVVSIALLVSWFTSVYFTPYIGFQLLRTARHPQAHHERFDTPFYRWLRRLVSGCLRHRRMVIAATIAAFVVGVASFALIPKQFFPNSSRVEVLADLWLPEGSSFARTEGVAERFEAFLSKQPDVADYVAYVGGGSPRFYLPLDQQLRFTNFTQFMVIAKDLKARERLVDALRRELAGYPDVRSKVDRLMNGPPTGWAVQFRVSGPDERTVRGIASQVEDLIAKNDPLVYNLHDNWHEPIPAFRVDVDQDKLRLLGISSAQVRQAGQTILNGSVIGRYRERNNDIDVVARQPLDERDNIGVLRDSYMPTATGVSVPFTQFATARPVFEPGIIWRRNRLPTITVQGLVPDGVQPPDVTAAIERQLAPITAALPDGYSIHAGGAYEESAIAQASINVNMPLLVIVIFLLLMIQLQHFGRSMLVFLTAPLGLIGAALALLVFQAPFGFVAILGVIALSGMIMRNSVILVDQIEQDCKSGLDPWNAIVESTLRRFRPIALTAAAAVLAMIPLTRSEFFGPMAVALMGGLIVATVLTLSFLPALYAAWFRVREPS